MSYLSVALGRYVLFRPLGTVANLRHFISADPEAGLVDVHLLPASEMAPALVSCRCELVHPCVAALLDTRAAGE